MIDHQSISSPVLDRAAPFGSARLGSIQALRALAALAVLFSHTLGDLVARSGVELWRYFYIGGAGVDLFFVISGFVMVHSSRRLFADPNGWKVFLERRLARIVPLYWAATFAYLLVQIAQGKGALLRADRIVASLAFWPYPDQNGVLTPVYGIGWTLNFELFFYAVFAAGLLIGGRRAVLWVCAALSSFVVAAHFVKLPAPWSFWSHSMVLEFVLGMGIAVLHAKGLALGRTVRVGFCVLAVICLVLSGLADYRAALPDVPVAIPRCIVWGLPAGLLVATAALVNDGPMLTECTIAKLGNGSYSIYLLHPLVIILLRPMVHMLQTLVGSPVAAGWIQLFVTVSIVVTISLFVHATFERPVTNLLKRRVGVLKAAEPNAVSP